jgi:hypothetical protein
MEVNTNTVFEFDELDIRKALCKSVGIDPTDSNVKVNIRHGFNQTHLDGGGYDYYCATVTHETKILDEQ